MADRIDRDKWKPVGLEAAAGAQETDGDAGERSGPDTLPLVGLSPAEATAFGFGQRALASG